MFATHPIPASPSTPYRQTGHYTPARPSPLGQRSSNIATPPWTMASAGQPKSNMGENQFSPVQFSTFSLQGHQTPSQLQQGQNQSSSNLFSSPSTSPFQHSSNQPSALMSPTSPSPSNRPKYADRYSSQIANPMKNTTSLARSKTRKMFLNRVRNDRDSGRFEARGEQMMMAEHMADKRKWEESMTRDVDSMTQGLENEDDNMLPEQEVDLEALNEFVSQEEAMEMALQETAKSQYALNASFSDEDYDDIFMAMPDPAQSQDMDMS